MDPELKKDKRKFARADKSLAVEYSLDKDNADELIRTFMRDISVGGGCIITYRSYVPGEILNLRISIPVNPKEWVYIKGRIVESLKLSGYKYSTRMEFIGVNHSQNNLIHEFVKWVHSVKGLKK